MANMDASQVTVGSASATGAIFVAPTTTALPTSALGDLTGYTLLGFTSDEGVSIAESSSTQSIRAWEGRMDVYTTKTEYTEKVSFTPIQCNADVAKLIWGDDMVSVDEGGNIVAKHHGKNMEPVHIVIETTPREGIVKRYCQKSQLTERGDATMDGTKVDARKLTFNNLADANGVTCYEYTAYTDGGGETGETGITGA